MPAATNNFVGRTALVTGAAHGLGRAYAIELASRGASVLVHDVDGDAALAAVGDIRRAGGTAEASIEDLLSPGAGRRVVEQALAFFGTVDVVIANAGFLRDRTFGKVTIEDFDAIVGIHLSAAAAVVHATWPGLEERGYGRVIFTTSSAALWGNFGQSNYAAAKAGVIGLARVLSLEGARKGIRVNTVAPLALTRLAQEVFEPSLASKLGVDQVVPFVTLLASEQCPCSGEVFEIGGGSLARVALFRGAGVRMGADSSAREIEDALHFALKEPCDRRFGSAHEAFRFHMRHQSSGAAEESEEWA